MSAPLITLLTDFGGSDAYVGVMKGVVLDINPAARLVDLTHNIPPQQVVAAALVLRYAVPYFPTGTIHVVVVDPGVGSGRHPILIETARGPLIGPDNGVLMPAAAVMGRRAVRLLDNASYFRQPVSQTFHGRDIFAPVAAHLSRGIAVEEFGRRVEPAVEHALPAVRRRDTAISGEVVYVDHFGNLITNIDAETLGDFHARVLSVSIESHPLVGPVAAYAAVPEGAPLAIVGSWGMLEIAVRNGNAARKFAAGPGTPVTVEWKVS